MNERSEIVGASPTRAAWLRWIIVVAAIAAWMLMAYRYPIYFKSDDWGWLRLCQTHTFVDTVLPTADGARAHDGRYRPIPYFVFMAQYRLFGLNSLPWHLILGFCFIAGMVFYFKLMSQVQDRLTGYLTIGIWLTAFQFLLTVLFWLGDIMLVTEMLLVLAGLYFFVTGLCVSPLRLAGGILLMLVAFFDREASAMILPTTAATYIATNGVSQYKLSRARTAVYSGLALMAGPLYFLVFPPSFRDSTLSAAHPGGALVAAGVRFELYSHHLLSGITGLILLGCASYYILARLTSLFYKKGDARLFPALAVSALLAALVVSKAQLYPVGIAALLVGAFLLPRQRYFLLPWAFIPLFGLLVLASATRTYLYEVAFALSAIAAIQARLLLGHLITWWTAHVKIPAVTYVVVGLIALVAMGMIAAKGKAQSRLLRLRSSTTMIVKDLAPHVRRLPPRSVFVIVDYASFGLAGGLPTAAEDEKILVQNQLLPSWNTDAWVKVIGRDDLKVLNFSTYKEDPPRYYKNSRVFLCLMTIADHRLAGELGIWDCPIASIQRGPWTVDLLELGPGG